MRDVLVHGPLRRVLAWPLILRVRWYPLGPAFLSKGQVGRHYRAVARNGRVLLASDRPLQELAGQIADLRLQTWHRSVLPGDRPVAYGVLLCSRGQSQPAVGPLYEAHVIRAGEPGLDLAVDLGGLRWLGLVRGPG